VTPYASAAFLHQLLGKALAAGGSDVHLKVGQAPGARVGADLVFFRVDRIRAEDTDAAARVLLGAEHGNVHHDVVAAYDADTVGRYRVTAFRQRGAVSLVLRRIPREIPTPASLGLGHAVVGLVEGTRGLVVLAGGPSSGRSTTAAALLGHLNETRARHVVTFEDPIEHIHEDGKGSVAQRAIGLDVASLAAGLRAARRQDVDVLFAADLGDADALDAAITASGRSLVLAVIAAPDVERALAWLSATSRDLADGVSRLASALTGVVAQRLVETAGKTTAVTRALEVDAHVREVLRRVPGVGSDFELSRIARAQGFDGAERGGQP
jgi:twitching motility protein PilT